MLEHKHIPVNGYPWLIAHNDESEHQIFYNIHDVQTCYRCRIPELVGKRMRACFHGWIILSNDDYTNWFLWNPASTNLPLLHLPPLLLESRPMCYLTSPPYVPGSILLLVRTDKSNFVFCMLDQESESPLRWIEMSYTEQLNSIVSRDDDKLIFLTCCNGEVYAVARHSRCVVKIHIEVKEKSVMISLLPFVNTPGPSNSTARAIFNSTFLIGSPLELFFICIGGMVDVKKKLKLVYVCLFKLDTSRWVWVEKEDLKDISLYVDLNGGDAFSCAVVSEIGGGYVHILHKSDKVLHSYNVKDKTISMSFLMNYLDLPPSYVALWPMHVPEFRLQSDGKCKAKEDEMVVKEVVQEEEEEIEAHVLNLPFDVLKMILEFCVGVEYLNFRATCKLCHLAAPLINKKVPQRRLKTYSLVSSPWLMVFDKRGGIFTFTDPMFGDDYFIRVEERFSHHMVVCSRYGWLLMCFGNSRLSCFFNPFTSETLEILQFPAQSMCTAFSFWFSAPPNSPDCMVMAFSRFDVFFHFVAGEPIWHSLDIGGDPPTYYIEFPTLCGRDVYALRNKEEVDVFKKVGNDYVWEVVVGQLPTCSNCSAAEYFLTTCNQHLLLVMVGDFGEAVEVFKLTEELEWEKMDSLGRHVIYVSETLATCLCMAAKTPEMENKIFFTRLHNKNGKVMFYSLETRKFHTFHGRNIVLETSIEDFYVHTYRHTYNHAWIEPTWC